MNSTGSFPNGSDMHEAYRFYQSNSRNVRTVQTNGFNASSRGTTSFAYFSKYFSHFEYGDILPQEGRPVTIDNTTQALNHYLFGDGSPVEIGPKTISALLNHPDFLNGHNQVMNDKLKKPYFYVDMTWTVFHIGDTRVSYSINEKNRTITYTLFDGDSFSDADFIDEYFMGKRFGEPSFQSDGLGPKLERFGGIPYFYIPVNITFHY